MSNRSKSMLVLVVGVLIPTQPMPTADASTPQVSGMKADFNGDGYEDLAIGAIGEDAPGAPDAGAVSVLYGSQSGLTVAGSQFFQQGNGGVPDQAGSGDHFGYSLAPGDFNGDGDADLAIGAPHDDFGSILEAGRVIVLQGSGGGLTAAGSTLWYQGSSCPKGGQIAGDPNPYNRFGSAVATGDFNGDTYDDLAIGVPGETEEANKVFMAGVVHIIYGSPLGLTCQDNQIWHQGNGIHDGPEKLDQFGAALATGYFNGDGREDLAIGVPGEDLKGVEDAGAVSVLFGTIYGLDAAGNQLWWQFGSGDDSAEVADEFGSALAAGYFDADSFEDLAIGVPSESLAGDAIWDAGAVNVLYGSSSGFTVVGAQFLSQATPGILGTPEEVDLFGTALASGDFQGDGSDDLAVGVPGDVEGKALGFAGSVNVLYGSGNQLWNQDSPGISDQPESDDTFGRSVGVGDFDGDGLADLAIGVPGEGYVAAPYEGVVHVLYGSRVAKGLSSAGSQIFWQGVLGQPAQPLDYFGWSLSSR